MIRVFSLYKYIFSDYYKLYYSISESLHKFDIKAQRIALESRATISKINGKIC